MAASSAFAATDGFTYETINGLTCKNVWIDAVYHNEADWKTLPFVADAMAAKARTATLATIDGKDVIVIGYSKTMVVNEESNDFAHIVIMDFATGALLNTLQLTVDGAPLKGLLCANNVGCDQFGNVWVAGYVATAYSRETGSYGPLKIYKVDDFTTGACSLQAELTLDPSEAADVAAGATRIDYCDLVGDITRAEASCTVMAAIAGGSDTWILGWVADQGSDKWEGAMDGYNATPAEETYPSGQADWGTAPVTRIIVNDDYNNDLFYIDGFTTCPSIYSPGGTMIDSFAAAADLAPATGTNGVGEFSLADKDFIAYSLNQYVAPEYCAVGICELGADMNFDGMTHYWTVPQNGLGDQSDSGTRMHCVYAKVYTDANGKEGAYVLTYKCFNGIGVYAIAEEGFEDPNQGGVNDVITDSNAPVQYFNLNGVEMNGNNLPAGLYITRQGTTVNKVVVK